MMECSVRFVYETNAEGKQIAGLKPALCVRGKKNALAVINDDLWIRTIELALPDHDKATYVLYHGEPYDPKAFADRFLMSAKSAGKPMTRRAKHLLTLRDNVDEDHLPQELLERDLEQERVYAENTPKERLKAAQRPSTAKDVTKEYAGKTYINPVEIAVSEPAAAPKKPPKKIPRTDLAPVVEKAHEAARKAISPPVKASKAKPNGTGKPATDRGSLVKRLALEFKMDPFDLRVLIRSTGMRAPYEDEGKVRDAVKRGKKLLAGVKKK